MINYKCLRRELVFLSLMSLSFTGWTLHDIVRKLTPDEINGRPLSLAERYAVLTTGKQKKDGGEERAGLSKTVELAVGMPVMVTWNVHTKLDIANGSRGEIVGIKLHPENNQTNNHHDDCVQNLTHPPAYVLVRLQKTKIFQLPGLPPHVIPIWPITKKFTINLGGTNITVSRTQLPITAAYAFTDYRAQGQTIVPVIVNIGRPPSGGLTPFNVYVALSRAKGRDSIRLLRDFDECLFQQHPSEYLRIEDDRLKELDRETKKW
jgi:ATP-dependent exoDNAse (exonuclease V) alpha subunit